MTGLCYIGPADPEWDGQGHPALARLGGITVLERQLRVLERAGCRRIVVWTDSAAEAVRAAVAIRAAGSAHVECRTADGKGVLTALSAAVAIDAPPVILLLGHVVCSAAAVKTLGEGQGIVLPKGAGGCVAAACLGRAQLDRLRNADDDALASRLEQIGVSLATATEAQTCFPIQSQADLRSGLTTLILAMQKTGGDFMGDYLHPKPENWMVHQVAETPVTPNVVSVINISIGILAAALFAHGDFRLGVLLALLVGMLDGVDGKLARLRLTQSKMGAFLDGIVTDGVLQTLWMLGLAWYGHTVLQDRNALWLVALALVSENLTRVVVRWYKLRFNNEEQLDLIPRFRKVRAGRNVYVFLLILAAIPDSPMLGLWGIALWAFACFAFRTGHGYLRARQVPPGKRS